jgi:hypothetical protein
VAQFQEAPKESYVLVVKRNFRYLKGTEKFGLWYPKGKDLSLIAYTGADWAGCIDDQRSMSGAVFYLDIQIEYDHPIPIYCDNTSRQYLKEPSDALQEEAHSNKVSLSTGTSCREEHQI